MRRALVGCLFAMSCAQRPTIYSRDPTEVHQATRAMAETRTTTASDIPRLVELLDDTAPHMTGECLRITTEPQDLTMGEKWVNSLGARRDACYLQPWPTTAGFAKRALAAWPDQNAVADVVVARAIAHPDAADRLAAVGAPALAGKLIAALRVHAHDDARRGALLRLALEVDGGDAEALRDLPGTRSATVILRWSTGGRTRARAIARLEADIERAIGDLRLIGPAAAAVLTPSIRARLWHAAGGSKWQMAGIVGAVAAARVTVTPDERAQMAKIYDRHCVEPDRKTEREMGEYFTMWHGADPDCDLVQAWLEAITSGSSRP